MAKNEKETVDEEAQHDEFEEELHSEEFHFDPEDWENLEGEEASKLLRGLEAVIPGILKRSIMSGLSSTLLSEDGIRSALGDKNIPKEAVGFILSQADATRREILRIVSREVRLFLENMDFGGEIAKILTTLSFEIRTEVRFIANEEAIKPDVKNKFRLKRSRSDGSEETLSEFQEENGEAVTGNPEGQHRESERKSSRGRRRWRRKKRDEDEDAQKD